MARAAVLEERLWAVVGFGNASVHLCANYNSVKQVTLYFILPIRVLSSCNIQELEYNF